MHNFRYLYLKSEIKNKSACYINLTFKFDVNDLQLY